MSVKAEVYCINISGLSCDVQRDDLKYEFDAFGKICDFQFYADQGYALISYTHQTSAILAIANGNNMILEDCPIQVQWARGWPKNRVGYKDFDSVLNETSRNNSTVHCYHFSNKTTINALENLFNPFGSIQDIYTKHCCSEVLVRFEKKEDATLAICTIDGTEVDGKDVCCEWSIRPIHQLVSSGWQRTRFANKGYQVPFKPDLLPSTNSSSLPSISSVLINRPSNRSISLSIDTVPNSTFRAPEESSTTGTNPFESESISLSSHSSEIRILFPDINNQSRTSARDYNVSGPGPNTPTTSTSSSRSDNVTTPATFSTKETSNISETSSAISNEQYTNYDFDTVFNQSRIDNCTVYCGGLSLNITYESLKELFSPFGEIEEIQLYADRVDYALIRFSTKVAATLAICSINNTEINGCRVKCIWSRRPPDQNHYSQGKNTFAGASEATKVKWVDTSHPDYVKHQLKIEKHGDEEKIKEKVKESTEMLSKTSKDEEQADEEKVKERSEMQSKISKDEEEGDEEKGKKETSEMLCKICNDEELGVVFLPCGHLTACEKCAQLIFICPMCRLRITNKIKTYF